jgi:hypothetical protein
MLLNRPLRFQRNRSNSDGAASGGPRPVGNLPGQILAEVNEVVMRARQLARAGLTNIPGHEPRAERARDRLSQAAHFLEAACREAEGWRRPRSGVDSGVACCSLWLDGG